MKGILRISVVLVLYLLIGCSGNNLNVEYPESFVLKIKNPIELDRKDATISLCGKKVKQYIPDFNAGAAIILYEGKEVASQSLSLLGEGHDHLFFVTDLDSGAFKLFTVRYAKSGEKKHDYPKRTQAEIAHKTGGQFTKNEEGQPLYQGGEFQNVDFLRVPDEHTDHSEFIRYEGPGWESDKVGYRFYLDWRNAVDIFGKKVPDMVLQNVGLDGYDSYHEMAEWGLDIFKVGESLGIGSIGMWYKGKAHRVSETDSVTCLIYADGPVYSQIRTQYYGWKVGPQKLDLTSDLSIWAGSRLTRTQLHLEGQSKDLCTGLAKHENTTFIQKIPQDNDKWGYIGLWGKQSLAGEDDDLGIAILFQKSQFIRLEEDELNHVVILKPADQKIQYFFLAAWAQEPEGITTEEAFKIYLDEALLKIENPVGVTIELNVQ